MRGITIRAVMVAYDPRRWPDANRRLRDETIDALREAIKAQREKGREPLPELEAAILMAAKDARDRSIQPEVLLVQLKLVAEEAGVFPAMGLDEGVTALREWLVSACVRAYFGNEGEKPDDRDGGS
jgi:hypothetical protein